MSEEPRGRPHGAAAGGLLLGSIVTCALAGLALGLLVDAPGLLAALGGAIGLPVGFWLVYSRYKNI